MNRARTLLAVPVTLAILATVAPGAAAVKLDLETLCKSQIKELEPVCDVLQTVNAVKEQAKALTDALDKGVDTLVPAAAQDAIRIDPAADGSNDANGTAYAHSLGNVLDALNNGSFDLSQLGPAVDALKQDLNGMVQPVLDRITAPYAALTGDTGTDAKNLINDGPVTRVADAAFANERRGALAGQTQAQIASGVSANIAARRAQDQTPQNTARSAAEQAEELVNRAQQAVSTRAAVQVLAEINAALLRQLGGNNLQVVQTMTQQMQQGVQTNAQLAVIANTAIQDRMDKVAAAQAELDDARAQANDLIDSTRATGVEVTTAMLAPTDTQKIKQAYADAGW